MNESKSIDVKIRSWLVRRISGRHKTDSLNVQVDKVVLHAVVETLHKTITKEVADILQNTITDLPQKTLAEVISKNTHLTELQKLQIGSILETPSRRNNSSYLG